MICPECNGKGKVKYYRETDRDENSVTVKGFWDVCHTCHGSGKKPMTNADRIRSMTDEEMVEFLFEYGAYTVCDLVCGGGCTAVDSFKETASQKCRKIILAKLREPYKEKEHGQTIGTDAEA